LGESLGKERNKGKRKHNPIKVMVLEDLFGKEMYKNKSSACRLKGENFGE
jgi:hypothetical protein